LIVHGGRGLTDKMRAEWARVRAVRAASIKWKCSVTVSGQSTRPGLLGVIKEKK